MGLLYIQYPETFCYIHIQEHLQNIYLNLCRLYAAWLNVVKHQFILFEIKNPYIRVSANCRLYIAAENTNAKKMEIPTNPNLMYRYRNRSTSILWLYWYTTCFQLNPHLEIYYSFCYTRFLFFFFSIPSPSYTSRHVLTNWTNCIHYIESTLTNPIQLEKFMISPLDFSSMYNMQVYNKLELHHNT